MRLSRLLRGIEPLTITGDPDGEVVSVCHDSAQCREGSLFVAIPGLLTDGHRFIADAIRRGARFVVLEQDIPLPAGVAAIRVRESRRALGLLGRNFFSDPSSEIGLIAVTGTNGKTTVTYLLESILRAAGYRVGVLGTVNYRYGGKILPAPNTTPESFEMQRILREMADHGVTHCVCEVSSHAVDLKRVDDCAFDLGVFTNLTQDHLDYHKTMENYFQAKKRFFTEVLPAGGKNRPLKAVINGDDPWGRRILREIGGVLTFGLEIPCDVTAEPFRLSLEGIEATLRFGPESLDIASPLLGRFNLCNILAAAAAARALGIPGRWIREGIAALAHVPGRLEKVSEAGQPAVFVDYAHTEDALENVLATLLEFRKGRIITVFGCGGDRDRTKRPGMGKVAAAFSDLAIITSDNPRTEDPLEIIDDIERGMESGSTRYAPEEIMNGFTGKGYTVLADRKAAIHLAVSVADSDDIILVAGKGHEDYQIVGTDKFPFDDRAVAREFLLARRTGGTH